MAAFLFAKLGIIVAMPSAIRHFIAALLLVLLPFQAMAASYAAGAAPVATWPDHMKAMDCCDPPDHETAGSCAAAGTCAAVTVPGLPSRAPRAAPLPMRAVFTTAVPSLHESFVPDGPQRPPQPRS